MSAFWNAFLILISMPDLHKTHRAMSLVVARAALESAHIVTLSWWVPCSAIAMASFSPSVAIALVPKYSPCPCCDAGRQTPAAAWDFLPEPSV